MKNNYDAKKAMKMLAKVCKDDNRIYYQNGDGGQTLVSDGRCIITVTTSDFEQYKDECFKKKELSSFDLKSFFGKYSTDLFDISPTIITVDVGRYKCRVFKVADETGYTRYMTLNQDYVDIIPYTIDNFVDTKVSLTDVNSDRIISPLVHIDTDHEGSFVCGFMILPVRFNVKEEINKIIK